LRADLDAAHDESSWRCISSSRGRRRRDRHGVDVAGGARVRVRAMIDSLGCRHVPPSFFAMLREAGIEVREFNRCIGGAFC
jgi:hypothetical protein